MTRTQRTAGAALAALASGALILNIAPVASAAGSPSIASQGAAIVERATGTSDIAPGTDSTAQDATNATTATTSDLVTVTVPRQSSGRVQVTGSDGTTLALDLPGTKNVTGVKSAAGTVVYPDAATGTDIAVQPTVDGGVRALITLKNSGAPTEHRFTLALPEGAALVANDQGGYDITRKSSGGLITTGRVDAPWAKDANGKPVPTSYKLEDGNTVVQEIDTTKDTAFPVVADPHYTWGWITGTVYLNKSETKDATLVGGAALTIAGILTRIPAISINGVVLATTANIATNHGQCVKIKSTGEIGIYGGSEGDGYCS